MTSKIKNIILFVSIIAGLALVYLLFVKKDVSESNLVSSSEEITTDQIPGSEVDSLVPKDFLSVLLGVKSLKLDETIFTNEAFINLRDSSIELVSTEDEGRPNPFAPIGRDSIGLNSEITTPVSLQPVIPASLVQ